MALQTGSRTSGSGGTSGGGNGVIRAMVVDDSAVVRGLITRILEGDPEITVVASVANGQVALNQLDRETIDVVVLDIEMPVMDGLTALPEMLKKKPGLTVIMASTLTKKNADISMRALSAGAADYVPKPSTSKEISGGMDFKQTLVEKVKALTKSRGGGGAGGGAPARASGGTGAAARQGTGGGAAAGRQAGGKPAASAAGSGEITLREAPRETPEIVVIGSSTGGPQALFKMLGALGGPLKQPILITQHMPPTFTTILADHVTRAARTQAVEARDKQVIEGGNIYIAPGDFHMLVEASGGQKVLRLDKSAPENFCRPAVDPMLRSVTKAYGNKVLAVILTGMGNDGLKGCQEVVKAGGHVIAQDEASSVVWGMPAAVAQAGLCSAVLPIQEIASYIKKTATRR